MPAENGEGNVRIGELSWEKMSGGECPGGMSYTIQNPLPSVRYRFDSVINWTSSDNSLIVDFINTNDLTPSPDECDRSIRRQL